MTLGDVFIALFAAFVAEEMLGLTKALSVSLVKRNARRLPIELRESYEEEWLRHLEDLHSNLAKLIFALDLWRASSLIQRESRGCRREHTRVDDKARTAGTSLAPSTAARLLASLTPREREVLRLVLAGRLNKQIAADLGTVEKTVKVHRARAMRKLDVRSLLQLVRVSATLGLFVLEAEFVQGPFLTTEALAIRDEKRAAFNARLATLTSREKQVLSLVLAGYLNSQIAAEMGIVEKTVKVHRARLMRKMAAGSIIELFQMAVLADAVPRSDNWPR